MKKKMLLLLLCVISLCRENLEVVSYSAPTSMKRFKAIESNRPIEDQRYRTKYHGSSESIAKDWKFLDDIYLITTQQPVSYENVVFLKMCNLSAHFEVNDHI